MTFATMVECSDGVSRPLLACVQIGGEWFHVDETVVTIHGERLLREDCVQLAYGSRWVRSDDPALVELATGDWGLESESTIIDGVWYDSEDCTSCDVCRGDIHNDDSYSAPDGGSLCQSCCEDETTGCDRCGDRVWNDDAQYDEEGDRYLCPRCNSRESSLIRSYGDKSANHKVPEHKGKDLYGVELEVEHSFCPETGAKYVAQFLDKDYVTFKRDGSLDSGGFEIVTRPDSMAVHKRKFKALFDDRPGRKLTSWSNGRCGMHVHINKAALSQLQLGKMLCFLNEPSNQNMVAKIAGRRANRWCRAYKKKVTDIHRPDERYVALNITERTAEMRIFRGTLSQAGFFKNLEFVEALVQFCAPANRGIREAVSASEFCKWLPRKQFPTLHKFLVEWGFIVWNHRRKAA